MAAVAAYGAIEKDLVRPPEWARASGNRKHPSHNGIGYHLDGDTSIHDRELLFVISVRFVDPLRWVAIYGLSFSSLIPLPVDVAPPLLSCWIPSLQHRPAHAATLSALRLLRSGLCVGEPTLHGDGC